MIDFVLEYGFSPKSLDIIPKEYELHQKLSNTPEEFEVCQNGAKSLMFHFWRSTIFICNVSSLYNPCEKNVR